MLACRGQGITGISWLRKETNSGEYLCQSFPRQSADSFHKIGFVHRDNLTDVDDAPLGEPGLALLQGYIARRSSQCEIRCDGANDNCANANPTAIESVVLNDHVGMAVSGSGARKRSYLDPEHITCEITECPRQSHDASFGGRLLLSRPQEPPPHKRR